MKRDEECVGKEMERLAVYKPMPRAHFTKASPPCTSPLVLPIVELLIATSLITIPAIQLGVLGLGLG